jgi:CRP-like cAMP-binding protein
MGAILCEVRVYRCAESGGNDMNISQAKLIVSRSGWLALCPEWFHAGLFDKASVQLFQRGERVHNSGPADSSGLWGIADGIAGIGLDFPERPDAVMHLVGPGFWGGAIELILGSGRKAFLTAVSPLTTVFVPASSFRLLAEKRPEAWRFMAMLPALNNAGALKAVEDILNPAAPQRLAAVLLRLSAAAGGPEDDGSVLVPLTQERIAEAANLSRTVAVAHLARLEKAGAVRRSYGAIRVIPARLVEHARSSAALSR